MHAERKITICSHKHSFTPYLSLSPYSQTDRMTDRDQIHLLHVGWRNFFPVVLLCQFFALAGNRFWFYILMYLEYNTVVMLCQFFGSGGKWFLTFCTYLVYNTVVRLCQFFGCGGKQLSKCEHVSTKKSYWVTLFDPIADVCIIRPTTLLHCIFLFCIFLLYCADLQFEVQMRILPKDKYRKSCQKCKHRQSHFDFLKNAIPFLYFRETTRQPKYVCRKIQPYSHNRFSKIPRTFYASKIL